MRRSVRSERCTGFTLIELLIVVAIIAILAAIAVPNFLEAQVRSKVSRTKADQRSLATAIEAYAVDYNRPPLGTEEINPAAGALPVINPWAVRLGWMWSQFTTPIAYLTSIPMDPFITQGLINAKGVSGNTETHKRFTYQATVRDNPIGSTNLLGWEHRQCKEQGVSWFVSGNGPSRRAGPVTGSSQAWPVRGIARIPSGSSSLDSHGFVWGYPDVFYDPTNGTVSFGFICRSSRGVE